MGAGLAGACALRVRARGGQCRVRGGVVGRREEEEVGVDAAGGGARTDSVDGVGQTGHSGRIGARCFVDGLLSAVARSRGWSALVAVVTATVLVGTTVAPQRDLGGNLLALGLVAVCCGAVRAYPRLAFDRSHPPVALAALLDLALVLGSNLFVQGGSKVTSPVTWLRVLALLPGLTCILAVGLALAARALDWLGGPVPAGTGRLFRTLRRVPDLPPLARTGLAALVILAAWLLWWPGAFPGVYGYDSIYQVLQYTTGGLSAHHPLLHTLMLGWCVVDLGGSLGSASAGFAVYVLAQMVAMSWLLGDAARQAGELSGPRATLMAAAVFALLPCFPLMALSSTKDSLFAALFADAFVCLCLCVRDAWGRRCPLPRLAKLAVLVALACLFRNNMAPAVGLAVVATLFALHRSPNLRWVALALVVALAVGMGSLAAIRVATGASDAPRKDSLSVPAQQLAAAMREDGGDLSDQDREGVASYLPTWDRLALRTADPVKTKANEGRIEADLPGFLGLWVRVGAKNPRIYLDALGQLCAGYWYWGTPFPIPEAGGHPYLDYQWQSTRKAYERSGKEAEGYYFVPMRGEGTPQGLVLKWFADGGWQDVPGLSVLCSPAAYVWELLASLYVLGRRRSCLAVALVLPLAYWLTLLGSPVALFRYAFCLTACLPTLAALLAASGGDAPPHGSVVKRRA